MEGRLRAIRLLAAATAILVLVAGLAWSLQRRLIYFPAGAPPPVATVLPAAEDVVLRTEDGLELAAWYVPAGDVATVVVFPGNGGNRAGRAPLAAALADAGFSVLLIDYRGYGGNPGTPTEAGLERDARAAEAWVRGRSAGPVIYLGESLGAAVAVGLAVERPPAALILRSPFTSLADVARHHYGPVPRWLLADSYPSIDRIGQVDAPLLVVAGDRDEIVPLAHSRRLFAAARDPKELLVVAGAGHNDPALLAGDEFVRRVVAFVRRHVRPA